MGFDRQPLRRPVQRHGLGRQSRAGTRGHRPRDGRAGRSPDVHPQCLGVDRPAGGARVAAHRPRTRGHHARDVHVRRLGVERARDAHLPPVPPLPRRPRPLEDHLAEAQLSRRDGRRALDDRARQRQRDGHDRLRGLPAAVPEGRGAHHAIEGRCLPCRTPTRRRPPPAGWPNASRPKAPTRCPPSSSSRSSAPGMIVPPGGYLSAIREVCDRLRRPLHRRRGHDRRRSHRVVPAGRRARGAPGHGHHGQGDQRRLCAARRRPHP